jgi:hypothetical protein
MEFYTFEEVKNIVNIIENIKNVALILFAITGLIHLTAGLMFSNNYMLPYSFIINRSFDIPFAIAGITYAFTTVYTNVEEKFKKTAGYILVIFAIMIFVGLLYINLLVPDKIPLITL